KCQKREHRTRRDLHDLATEHHAYQPQAPVITTVRHQTRGRPDANVSFYTRSTEPLVATVTGRTGDKTSSPREPVDDVCLSGDPRRHDRRPWEVPHEGYTLRALLLANHSRPRRVRSPRSRRGRRSLRRRRAQTGR